MEYCDLGNLDSAISDGRFSDMVRPNAALKCLRKAHLPPAISLISLHLLSPHQDHLAWWFNQTVYVPGGLGFKPQRSRGLFGLPGVQVGTHQ